MSYFIRNLFLPYFQKSTPNHVKNQQNKGLSLKNIYFKPLRAEFHFLFPTES